MSVRAAGAANVTAVTITPTDLAPFATIPEAKAQAMIDDALAWAAQVAPCILDADFTQPGAAKAIIRGAILRWNDAGSGGVTTQESAGPMARTVTAGVRKSMFFPSEIIALQKLCGAQRSGRAYSFDTTPPAAVINPLEGAVINLPEVDE